MSKFIHLRALLQVGAGEGQWQAELRRRGADVTWIHLVENQKSWTQPRNGGSLTEI